MSYLTKSEILKQRENANITIEPFNEKQLGPNSYNVRLASTLKRYTCNILDMKENNPTEEFSISNAGYVIMPGELYLGRTIERTFSPVYDIDIDGRSSIGRLGLFIHVTAGRGDVGFHGFWTLELTAIKPVRVYLGVEIGQVYFSEVIGDVEPYHGKYQDNNGIQSSQMYKEFEVKNERSLGK